MALQLQQQGSGCSSLVLLDGSQSFLAAYMDRTLQRLEISGDTVADTEAAVISIFVSHFALRLVNTEEVFLV